MSGSYEYERKTFETSSSYVSQLQELGNQGWEVVEIPTQFLWEKWVMARRLSTDVHDTWEYHSFDVGGMPSAWWDHIRSCGWTIMDPPYFAYINTKLHFAKRPGMLRGSDDGDVQSRLLDLGYPNASHPSEEVSAILKIKWDESLQQGHNIGTYNAVRYWLSHVYLPRLFKRSGLGTPNQPLEVVLDNLLRVREAEESGRQAPLLDESLIQRWIKMGA